MPTHAKLPDQRTTAAIDSAGRGVLITEPMPELLPGHVAVRLTASMISPGTQLNGVKDKRENPGDASAPPRPFGYQAAGEVVALGDHVNGLNVGDRVACLGPGAKHTDWAIIPQNLCGKVPDNVSDADASAMNLMLTAQQAIRRAEPVLGEYMLIVGMGLVGQYAAQLANLAGMETMAWDTMDSRLRIAEQCGVRATVNIKSQDVAALCSEWTEAHGFDAAVMAIGGDGTAALESVRDVMKVSPDRHFMGRVVMVGGLSTTVRWGAAMGNLDLRCSGRSGPGYHDKQWETGEREYPPVFVRWSAQERMRLTLRWLADGRLKTEPLITHRMPLENVSDAVDMLIERPETACGVVLTS